MRKMLLGSFLVVAGCAQTTPTESSTSQSIGLDRIPNNLPIPNSTGLAATYNTNDDDVDLTGPFFTSFGTNGRVCGTCHTPTDGWSVTPLGVQLRFDLTGGTDPIFRTNDGSVSPNADVSTVAARRVAYNMLLTKALIRVGIGVPANAQYDLTAVADPYNYASAAQLSLFRRPLQASNLNFLSTVMWDGRETFVDSPAQPDDNCLKPPFAVKCFKSLDYDLSDQANQATLGHAQATMGLTPPEEAEIVAFETGLDFAQVISYSAGLLDDKGATGGPDAIASLSPYFGENDNFGDYKSGAAFTPDIFNLYNAWSGTNDPNRASIARGQALFNSKPITISGVGGLNGSLGLPASFSGTCGTCHDTPDGGDHSVPAPLNIGTADPSQNPEGDLPRYTLTCNAVGAAAGACTEGQSVTVTDPGRALITGAFADIGKFKGPTLRGIAARAPYFHNGMAADLGAVVDFYDTRFGIGFTSQERSDLIAFLSSL